MLHVCLFSDWMRCAETGRAAPAGTHDGDGKSSRDSIQRSGGKFAAAAATETRQALFPASATTGTDWLHRRRQCLLVWLAFSRAAIIER
ncbi:MAG: hypothetical protein NVS9B4_13730 [Candidatus Acidiferrum sp.]